MHPFGITIHLALCSLDIRIPDCIASSMGMAHIVSEMNTFAANITFSHLDTSSTPAYSYAFLFYVRAVRYPRNSDILPEMQRKSKQKKYFFIFLQLLFPFLGKAVRIQYICLHKDMHF